MFSKGCEYGIRAVLFIAHESLNNRRVSLKAIANTIDSPVAFTAKILQTLARENIVQSAKGAGGGYEINKRRIDTIKLSQIVDAIDGDSIYRSCGLGLKKCTRYMPCPVHNKFAKVRGKLKFMLENTTIYEMTSGLEAGLTYLKR